MESGLLSFLFAQGYLALVKKITNATVVNLEASARSGDRDSASVDSVLRHDTDCVATTLELSGKSQDVGVCVFVGFAYITTSPATDITFLMWS